MKIEVKKLNVKISGNVEGRGGGEFDLDIEDYKSEMDPEEFLQLLKTYLELLREYIVK